MQRFTRRRAALILSLGVILPLSAAGSASASVPGLELLSKTSVSDSFNKGSSVACPAGKRAVGAGGSVVGGNGQVVLDDVEYNQGGASAFGREDADGFAGTWFVRPSVICANPLAGQRQVSAVSPSTSSNKTVSVSCPAGQRVVGAGAVLSGAGGQVSIDDLIPNDTLTGVDLFARELGAGTPANWTIRVQAMCADPLPGLELISADSDSASFPASAISATCSPGKKLLGGGAELTGSAGKVALKEMRPNGANLVSMVASAEEIQGGNPGDWDIKAYAICATA